LLARARRINLGESSRQEQIRPLLWVGNGV